MFAQSGIFLGGTQVFEYDFIMHFSHYKSKASLKIMESFFSLFSGLFYTLNIFMRGASHSLEYVNCSCYLVISLMEHHHEILYEMVRSFSDVLYYL